MYVYSLYFFSSNKTRDTRRKIKRVYFHMYQIIYRGTFINRQRMINTHPAFVVRFFAGKMRLMFADIIKISRRQKSHRETVTSSIKWCEVMITSYYYNFLLSVSSDRNVTNASADYFSFPRNENIFFSL